MRYDLIVAGHIVIDYIRHGGRIHGPYLGGPCVYSGLAARALDASVSIMSTVGLDFGNRRISWLRPWHLNEQHSNCRLNHDSFHLNYDNGHRKLQVSSACEPIQSADITTRPSSRAVHIGPVLSEITPSAVLRFAQKDVVMSFDPQGYFRRVSANGSIRNHPWRNHSLLKKIMVLKISEEESALLGGVRNSFQKLSRLGPQVILLTKGRRGTTVWTENEGSLDVPSYPTTVRVSNWSRRCPCWSLPCFLGSHG